MSGEEASQLDFLIKVCVL